MQRMLLKISAFVVGMSLTAFGQQSLGDVARQLRAKQQAEEAAGNAPKMYTNQDIPAAGQVGTPEPVDQSRTRDLSRYYDTHNVDRQFAEQRAAGEWHRNIVMQENRVASLQLRIDRLNAMLHSPYGTAQYDGPQTRNQAMGQQRLEQMQQALDQQKTKLEAMQDAARRAGMHTVVYDP